MEKYRQVLKGVVVTEKSLTLAEKRNQYTFEVDPGAEKTEIGRSVAKFYGVTVEKVRTMLTPSRKRRMLGHRGFSETGERKKAVVTLKKGDKIEALAGGEAT